MKIIDIQLIKKNFSLVVILPVFLIKAVPHIINPRLWAEEGTVYLLDSLNNGFFSVFSNHQGYYSILPSFCFYIASLFNPTYYPYFSTYLSIVIWLSLFLLINNTHFPKISEKITDKLYLSISVVTILFSFPEIFLNTINLQFITPLILIFLLNIDFEKHRKYVLIVLIGMILLNGVISLFFLPLVLYKFRKSYSIIYVILFIVVLQVLAIFSYEDINEKTGVISRLTNNCVYFLDVLQGNVLPNYRDVFSFFGIIIFFFISIYMVFQKKYYLFHLFTGILFSFIFISVTKIFPEDLSDRYFACLASLGFVGFYVLFCNMQLGKFKYIFMILSLCFLFTYAIHRNAFLESGYDKNLPYWRFEAEKFKQNKPARIHPYGWSIKQQ